MSDAWDNTDVRDATPEEETMVNTILGQRKQIEELEAKLKTMIEPQVSENMVRVAEPMLSDALAVADKRIEELEKACKEWADVSQSNYQRAKAAEAKLAKALEEMMKVDEYLTRLQTPNTEPLNSVNSCPTKKGRGQYTAMVRNEAREYWASLGNAIAELKGEQP